MLPAVASVQANISPDVVFVQRVPTPPEGLVRNFYGVSGATSTTSGYAFGGKSTSFNDTYSDQIQSFNFSDSNNATDVGMLSAACFSMGSNLHY